MKTLSNEIKILKDYVAHNAAFIPNDVVRKINDDLDMINCLFGKFESSDTLLDEMKMEVLRNIFKNATLDDLNRINKNLKKRNIYYREIV